MKEIVRRILDADATYGGDGMMLALYFMVLIMMIFVFRESKMKKSFALPSVILLIFVYAAFPTVTGSDMVEANARFFWLLLAPVITAIGFTYLVFKMDKRNKRLMLIAVMFPLFLFCGTFQISSYRFQPYENLYRLPQSTVDITSKVLSEKSNPKLVTPYTIAHPFRQISTDVRLLYGEDASYGRIEMTSDDILMISDEMERTIPNLNYICAKMEEYDCDYIVFDTVYTELCENGNINAKGYPIDPNYVGDRTPTIGYGDLKDISVTGTPDEPYWDLSAYDLEYDGAFGQYVLYRRVK